MNFQTLFFTGEGRIGRQEFWIGFLILMVGGIVVGWIPFINLIAGFVLTYMWVCLYAKRLHDMGKSGFLLFIPFGAWFLAGIAAALFGGIAILSGALNDQSAHSEAAAAMGIGGVIVPFLVSGLISLAFLLWVGISTGQSGDNKFGSPPSAHPLAPVAPPAPTVTPPAAEPSPPPPEPPVA